MITPLPAISFAHPHALVAEITVCLHMSHTCFTYKAQNLPNGSLKRTEGKEEHSDAGYSRENFFLAEAMLSVGFDAEKIKPPLPEGSDRVGKSSKEPW